MTQVCDTEGHVKCSCALSFDLCGMSEGMIETFCKDFQSGTKWKMKLLISIPYP